MDEHEEPEEEYELSENEKRVAAYFELNFDEWEEAGHFERARLTRVYNISQP